MNELEMKENFTFDFFNPDFISGGKKALSFLVPNEFKFFLSHKIISWLNVVNESIDCEFIFERVMPDDFTLQGQSHFSLNINTHNGDGTIYLYYDKNNQFTHACLLFLQNVYKNENKFPKNNNLFEIEININNNMEVDNYILTRKVSSSNILGLQISYKFDCLGKKLKDFLLLDTYEKNQKYDPYLLSFTKENLNELDFFDDFFNEIIETILLSPNDFLELTTQFTINKINSKEEFEIFYDELRDYYKTKNLSYLENALEVVEMITI